MFNYVITLLEGCNPESVSPRPIDRHFRSPSLDCSCLSGQFRFSTLFRTTDVRPQIHHPEDASGFFVLGGNLRGKLKVAVSEKRKEKKKKKKQSVFLGIERPQHLHPGIEAEVENNRCAHSCG
ncbi:hypothetical protein CEXT_492731 [Caerostris extrusa]|uniref:Uncharacterized protein n=1 Tax=Caerostris extrusa TaxID=172846 RepID=A0AAV4MHC0_CAEEX|nr:hypothetical protein CEXT_492731 [Caerostris extrusa]